MTSKHDRTLGGQSAGLLIALSSLIALSTAFALPLLDLLGRNPEFFLAKSMSPLEVILFGFTLALFAPLLAAVLVWFVYRLSSRTGKIVHALVVGTSLATIAVTALNRSLLSELPGWSLLLTASLTGLVAVWAYYRFEALRAVTPFLAFAPIAVLSMFLFLAPVSRLIFGESSPIHLRSVEVRNPFPVVMVVFDEFPIASIINREGEILAEHFPGLAQLSQEGTWYRNAVGVYERTPLAIPAIVSGVKTPTDERLLPIASDHPNTLFSLLSGSYTIHAVETLTELCSRDICREPNAGASSTVARLGILIEDLSLVGGHVILPSDMRDGLPAIDQTWGNFGGDSNEQVDSWNIKERLLTNVETDRRVAVNEFVNLFNSPLHDGELYFAHFDLPHVPWIHLPDGRLYAVGGSLPGFSEDGWGSDRWLVEQSYQRHLLQVQYVDNVVRTIIHRLKASGSYETTLVLVLADHGVSVRPNLSNRRDITAQTVGDVAAIPLFIKAPHQSAGRVDDFRAETVDILPTIADILQVDVPWKMDGSSLIAEPRPTRSSTTMTGRHGDFTFGVTGAEKLAVASYHATYFGERGPFGLAPPGLGRLLGREVSSLEVVDASNLEVVLDNPDWYDKVVQDGDFAPVLVSGTIVGGNKDRFNLAISVDGRLVAITQTWLRRERQIRFQAIIPPSALQDGTNNIDVMVLHQLEEGFRLQKIAAGDSPD